MSESFTYPNPGSEYGEDAWILANLKLPERGFYVDIGAMRPNALSNTWFLRQRGWHGLAIDGHPECGEFWKDVPNAKFAQALLSEQDGEVVFKSNGPCSRIIDSQDGWRMRTCQLGYVLSCCSVNQIDFLSIDIEGQEYAAMTTFPFDRLRPGIIVAEYDTLQPDGSVKEDLRLRELLLTKGYKEAHRTVANIIFTLA